MAGSGSMASPLHIQVIQRLNLFDARPREINISSHSSYHRIPLILRHMLAIYECRKVGNIGLQKKKTNENLPVIFEFTINLHLQSISGMA